MSEHTAREFLLSFTEAIIQDFCLQKQQQIDHKLSSRLRKYDNKFHRYNSTKKGKNQTQIWQKKQQWAGQGKLSEKDLAEINQWQKELTDFSSKNQEIKDKILTDYQDSLQNHVEAFLHHGLSQEWLVENSYLDENLRMIYNDIIKILFDIKPTTKEKAIISIAFFGNFGTDDEVRDAMGKKLSPKIKEQIIKIWLKSFADRIKKDKPKDSSSRLVISSDVNGHFYQQQIYSNRIVSVDKPSNSFTNCVFFNTQLSFTNAQKMENFVSDNKCFHCTFTIDERDHAKMIPITRLLNQHKIKHRFAGSVTVHPLALDYSLLASQQEKKEFLIKNFGFIHLNKTLFSIIDHRITNTSFLSHRRLERELEKLADLNLVFVLLPKLNSIDLYTSLVTKHTFGEELTNSHQANKPNNPCREIFLPSLQQMFYLGEDSSPPFWSSLISFYRSYQVEDSMIVRLVTEEKDFSFNFVKDSVATVERIKTLLQKHPNIFYSLTLNNLNQFIKKAVENNRSIRSLHDYLVKFYSEVSKLIDSQDEYVYQQNNKKELTVASRISDEEFMFFGGGGTCDGEASQLMEIVSSLDDVELSNDYQISVPKTKFQYREWGDHLQICIYSAGYYKYLNDTNANFIIGIIKKGENFPTFVVEFSSHGIGQNYGFKNKTKLSQVEPEVYSQLAKILTDKEIIKTDSEPFQNLFNMQQALERLHRNVYGRL